LLGEQVVGWNMTFSMQRYCFVNRDNEKLKVNRTDWLLPLVWPVLRLLLNILGRIGKIERAQKRYDRSAKSWEFCVQKQYLAHFKLNWGSQSLSINISTKIINLEILYAYDNCEKRLTSFLGLVICDITGFV
jgi:hypothetical protein